MKLFALLFLFVSTFAVAEDVTVFYKKGVVKKVDYEGNEVDLKKGDTLIEGDTLKTLEDSLVILKIGTHSTHRVEENSEILIEQLPYNYEESKELEQGGGFFLKVGTIFCEIFQRASDESFKVRTKSTTMGVRGTKLMASIDTDSNDTWLTVNEGRVEVSNALSKNSDLVENGKSMVVENDKTFTQQKKYEWQNNLKWDIEKNKDNFKSFRQQRKLAYKEFRNKRSSWTRNESRWSEFKKRRKARLAKFRERVKGLKSSKRLQRRKELRQKIRERRRSFLQKGQNKVPGLKDKKKFYRQGLIKNNGNDSYNPNSFMDKKKKRNIRKRLKDRRDTLQQNRRSLRRRENFRRKRRKNK